MTAGRTNHTLFAAAPKPEIKICATERDSWTCPNMKEKEGDTSMTHEHYKCEVCGRTMAIDYDEIR